MPVIPVAVINASTCVSDEECRAVTAALQTQVSRDFAPAWGVDAKLTFVPKDSSPPVENWWLSVLDDTDRALVLGHHELTAEGLPVGKVFAGTDQRFGLKWSVTASHELLELLADPFVNLTVFSRPEPGLGTLYAYEVCDPCQDEEFAYEIDGVSVCDFVYPAYFDLTHPPRMTKYDHVGALPQPAPHVLKGGYITVYEVHGSQDWQPVKAATVPHGPTDRTHIAERTTHRRQRRGLPHNEWQRSTAFR